jgi:hypothetical protein
VSVRARRGQLTSSSRSLNSFRVDDPGMGAQKCHIFQYNNFKKFNIKRKIVYSKKKVSIKKKVYYENKTKSLYSNKKSEYSKKKFIIKNKKKVSIQTKKVYYKNKKKEVKKV